MYILRNINESSDDNFEPTSLENLDLCFQDSVSINETIQAVYMSWIFNQFQVLLVYNVHTTKSCIGDWLHLLTAYLQR
jgi:hypothetical protein